MNTPSSKPHFVARRALGASLAASLLFGSAGAKEHFGRPLARLPGLSEPRAVAFDASGRVWVADTGNHRIAVFDAGGARRDLWGERGSAPGQLLRPAGIDVAPDGTVFVADTGNHRVQVFDAEGVLRFAFGGRGRGDGELCEPLGIDVNERHVVVADSGNQRVQVFARDGSFERSFGLGGDFEGAFLAPVDVCLDVDGRIHVVDGLRQLVVTLDANGRTALEFGGRGDQYGLFSQPAAVDVFDGRMFVADGFNHRVQEFDRAGRFVATFPGPAFVARSQDGKLFAPAGIAVSPRGDLIAVAEPLEDRVQLFCEAPPHDAKDQHAGHTGIEDSLARVGRGADAAGNLLVAVDPELRAVSVFDTSHGEPVLLTRLGALGGTGIAFLAPRDAAVDIARSWIHVSDPVSGRLQSLRLRRDPGDPLSFAADMGRLVRSIDFDDLPARAGLETLTWPVQPGALAVAGDGSLWLADERNGAIVALAPSGRPRSVWTRVGERALLRPVNLAFSLDGEVLFVSDADAQRVLALDLEGGLLAEFGVPAENAPRLLEPSAALPLDGGRLLVVDRGADCVQVFEQDGTWLRSWGRAGAGPAQMHQPSDVLSSSGEVIYLIDPGNRRGQVLTPDGRFLLNF